MTRLLWSSSDVASATGTNVNGAWKAGGVSIDSRTLKSGDLFVALKGPRFDGHDYVGHAFKAGAVAAMVAAGHTGEGPLVTVSDTKEGLRALAVYARDHCYGRIIAVTGSSGKTGTKNALALSLAESGPTHASAASHNNHWGVPLSLSRLPATSSYGVFEIGMSKEGEIAPLSCLVRPHVAIITNVHAAHAEFFDSVSAIANEKAEVFSGIEPGGAAILNRDSPHFFILAAAAGEAGANVISYGADSEADVRVIKRVLLDHCSTVSADVCGKMVTYKVGAPGAHWVENSLAVLAAVEMVGADLGRAALVLSHLKLGRGRGERTRVDTSDGCFDVIDESYNANPASVRAALAVLGAASVGDRGRRIAVLGDMRELGDKSEVLHAELGRVAEESGADIVITVGHEARALHDGLSPKCRGAHADTADEVVGIVTRSVKSGDVVLIKGSNALGMGAVADALRGLHEQRGI